MVIAELKQSGVETLPWPARSSYLSPIEHLWVVIRRNIYDSNQANPPTKLHTLAQQLVEEWKKVPQHVISKLIASVPNRLKHTGADLGGYKGHLPPPPAKI